jgi:hypothetical protein
MVTCQPLALRYRQHFTIFDHPHRRKRRSSVFTMNHGANLYGVDRVDLVRNGVPDLSDSPKPSIPVGINSSAARTPLMRRASVIQQTRTSDEHGAMTAIRVRHGMRGQMRGAALQALS